VFNEERDEMFPTFKRETFEDEDYKMEEIVLNAIEEARIVTKNEKNYKYE
jgi:hypothetical protein